MVRPRFIRPAGGFRIELTLKVQVYIEAECDSNPDLKRFWDALFTRLKMTALREGTEVREGLWSFIAEGSPKLSVPTLQVMFTHDLQALYVHNAMVWQPGDEEDGE